MAFTRNLRQQGLKLRTASPDQINIERVEAFGRENPIGKDY